MSRGRLSVGSARTAASWWMLGLGCLLLVLAIDVVGQPIAVLQRGMLGLCAAVFLAGGVVARLSHHSRWADAGAAVICLLFAALGASVAVFAPADEIVGGLPLVSPEFNVILGRGVFALGALLSTGIAMHALRRFVSNQ